MISNLGPRTTQARSGFTFNSDGTFSTDIGGFRFNSDGTTSTKIGGTRFNSDGTTETEIGSFRFGSDGKTGTKIGNTWIIWTATAAGSRTWRGFRPCAAPPVPG